jgi:hypothetical protein
MRAIMLRPAESLFSFLFAPHRTALNQLNRPEGGRTSRAAYVYVAYLSVLLGITLWFFLFYPEPLYYGVSGEDLKAEVPSILVADPLLSLGIMVVIELLFTFVGGFLAVGTLSFLILRRLSRGGHKRISLGAYLGYFAQSFHPMLFLIPLITWRFFFYERWVNLKPMYPFVDWTTNNVIAAAILAGIMCWKLFIELRLNQAAFRASLVKALVPVLVQVVLLAGVIAFPYLLNDLFFNAFKDTLV